MRPKGMTKQVRWSAAAESSWDLPSMKARPTRPTGGLPHGANRLKTSNDERRGVQPLRFDEAVPAPDLRVPERCTESGALHDVPHLRFSALRAAGKAGYRLPDSVGDRQQGESLLRQPHVSGDRGDIHPQAAQRTLRRGGFHARRDARLRHRRAVRTLLQTKVSGCFIRTSGGQLTAAYSFLICAVNESPAPTPSATSTCGVATYDMPSGVNTWLPTAPQVSITVRSPYFSSRSRHCACMPNIRLTTVNSSSFVFRILLRQSESWTTSDE